MMFRRVREQIFVPPALAGDAPDYPKVILNVAFRFVLSERRAGRKVYICRRGGSGPMMLVSEERSYWLVDNREGQRSLLWWRWQLWMWREIELQCYGYDRNSVGQR